MSTTGWGHGGWGRGVWGTGTSESVTLTGISATGAVGSLLTSNASFAVLTGVSATGALGTLTENILSFTGVVATGAVGTITVDSGTVHVFLTGIAIQMPLSSLTIWVTVGPGVRGEYGGISIDAISTGPISGGSIDVSIDSGWQPVPGGSTGGWSPAPSGATGGWVPAVT